MTSTDKESSTIEKLNLKLFEFKTELDRIKYNIITAEVLNVILYIGEIISFMVLKGLDTPTIITNLIFTYVIVKGFNLIIFGSRIGRYIKRKKIKLEINNIEREMTLSEMKPKKDKVSVNDRTMDLFEKDINYNNVYSYSFVANENIDNFKTDIGIGEESKKYKRVLKINGKRDN